MPQLSTQISDPNLPLHDSEPPTEADPAADIDEPPDSHVELSSSFQKRRPSLSRRPEVHESLLTKALHGYENTTTFDTSHLEAVRKRPWMASSTSLASTAELTCDTGNTTPARQLTPSPPHPDMTYLLNRHHHAVEKPQETRPLRQPRISFACAEPPKVATQAPQPSPPKAVEAVGVPRRTTIKFACAAEPYKPYVDPPQRKTSIKFACSAIPRSEKPNLDAPANNANTKLARHLSLPNDSVAVGPHAKSTNDTQGLEREGTRFYEFASDECQLDDWIVQDRSTPKSRLTMSDILEKESAIRKLGKEVLEEEEEEDDDDGEEEAGDDAEDESDDGNGADDDDEVEDANGDDDGPDHDDDGYRIDTEHGFADSDDESDTSEGDIQVDVPVWFPGHNPEGPHISPCVEVYRPAGSLESHSSVLSVPNVRIIPTRRIKVPRRRPDLPDSTDFVCGTFDEDRVVEDLYMSVAAAKKRSKLHAIPQDIDPSFPESDPEDEEDNDDVSTAHQDSEEHVLGFGDLEDLHGEAIPERPRRRSNACSPRVRCRSPPPPRTKKHISPPPRVRGRSPRPLFGRTSPRRIRSPAPMQLPKSPRASPMQRPNGAGCKPLAARPGLTIARSLPRPVSVVVKQRRKSISRDSDGHTRGAIDIVKGLEQKRQRRREKYLQKYCDRARKGQNPEKHITPGKGAERMRELGLYMAGKLGPGYVLSI